MSDVTVETTDATPKEEVVASEEPDSEAKEVVIPRFGDDWKPVEGTNTHPHDWSKDDIKYFGKASWGDNILMDEDGVGEWGDDLVNCHLKVDPSVTSARDFVTMVRADAVSGKMTVDDIFKKYCVD